MIRHLLAGLLISLAAMNARSETYEHWIADTPPHAPIGFKNWLPAATQSLGRINDTNRWEFEPPIGHLFGFLDLTAVPSANFPLRLRFLYRHIDSSSINSAPNDYAEKVKNWMAPIGFLATDAPLGDLIQRREVEVKSTEASAIPVWSIMAPSPMNRGGEQNGNPYSVAIEVVGHDGSIVGRQRLIEAVAGLTTRDVALARPNSGEDTFLNTLANLNIGELPPDARAFEDIKVLWLDEDSLHNAQFTDSYWRQVFFAGTMVVGKSQQVQELAQRLGISPNQRVLLGGLWSDNSGANLEQQLKPGQGRYDLDLSDAFNPFHWSFELGRKPVEELRQFSIWFLVVFTLGETAVIIASLYLLRGYQRVFRWVLIPMSAILYTLASFLIVHMVVDFRPEAQIFQTVYSVEGWPDSFVRTRVERLAFENGRATFDAPALAEFDWRQGDDRMSPTSCDQTLDGTTFSWREKYGRFSLTATNYWIKSDSPCHVTADRQIVVTRPLRGAWVWDGHFWRNLGPLKPGEPVSIDKAHVVVEPAQIPADNQIFHAHSLFEEQSEFPEIVSAMCSRAYMDSLKNTNVGILLAIDDQPAPGQMADAKVSEIHQQTILVHQFSFPSATR